MMQGTLIDLDELILKCRNDAAKNNIKEAVANYRVGAYRSAIISTWLAVFFDVLDKYKELAASGDGAANDEYEKYKKIVEGNDVRGMMAFEDGLIQKIYENFEFISYGESVDLKRLREDRHRCAHPTIDLNLDVYNPPAELARTHLRSAVEYLLQYPPTSGKKSIDIILRELESEYIATYKESVLKALGDTPIKRLKKSAVRGLLVAIIDKVLNGCTTEKYPKYYWALELLAEQYPEEVNLFGREDFNNRINKVELTDLRLTNIAYIGMIPLFFEALDPSVLLKIEVYISRVNVNTVPLFEYIYMLYEQKNVSLLSSWAEKRILMFTQKEYELPAIRQYRGAVVDRFIELYTSSSNYTEANMWRDIYLGKEFKWTAEQVKRFLKLSYQNTEVRDSFNFKNFIEYLIIGGHPEFLDSIDAWKSEAAATAEREREQMRELFDRS